MMEKLIYQYNKNCNLTSKSANRLWRIGQVIILLIFSTFYILYKEFFMGFCISIVSIIILYFICTYIEIVKICNKLQINLEKKYIFKRGYRRRLYEKFDIFQKRWITDYCKQNKIDKIEKLKLLREELERKQDNGIIKYIDPIIIGTLLLSVWEILVQKMSEKFGTMNAIIICTMLAVILSIVIGWLRKEWQEQKDFMSIFNRFSGYNRLSNLLLYRILKTNR